jgi:hypothetical protein
MWESIAVIAIVSAALFFTARPLVRLLKSGDGYCKGCTGCSRAPVCPTAAGSRGGACQTPCGMGVTPIKHGRDARATPASKGFRSSLMEEEQQKGK